MNEIKRWYTITEYVDTETGELISKSKQEREYLIIKTTIKYKIHENKGFRNIRKECTRNRQQKLF